MEEHLEKSEREPQSLFTPVNFRRDYICEIMWLMYLVEDIQSEDADFSMETFYARAIENIEKKGGRLVLPFTERYARIGKIRPEIIDDQPEGLVSLLDAFAHALNFLYRERTLCEEHLRDYLLFVKKKLC